MRAKLTLMLRSIFSFCLILISYTFSSAQVDTVIMIDDVEVSSTRLVQTKGQSGRDIRVVTLEEIRTMGVRSIDEAIQLLGGVEAQTRGPFGVQADFSMRGSTFNQVMVLIDGQLVNDPLTGHFNSNLPVTLSEIRRIEILRGPASAVYGPNAVGGVINIVTIFDENEEVVNDISGGVIYGANGLFGYNLAGRFNLGGLAAFVHHQDNRADGESHPGDSTSQFFEVQTTTAGLRYDNENLKLGFKAGWDRRDFDARYFYTASSFDRSEEEVSRVWLHGRASYSLGRQLFGFQISRMRTEDEFVFSPTTPANEHTTWLNDLRLEWKTQWSKEWKTNFGVQVQDREIESNDRGDHQEVQTGFFGLASFTPFSGFDINGALRLDHQEVYGWQWNPQLAMRYASGIWRFRAFAGRSIRAADFTERFVNFGRTTTLASGRNLGNANLQTEKAWTTEAGVTALPLDGLELGIQVFYRSSSDLIDYVLTSETEIEDNRLLEQKGSYFYSQNIASLETIGGEVYARYRREWGKDWTWQTVMQYSYVDSKNDSDEVSKYIASHAGHFLSWHSSLRFQDLRLALSGVYKHRSSEEALAINAELDPAYHVMHAKLSYVLGQHTEVFAQAHNVLDTDYSDILGVNLPGLWWSIGIQGGLR